MAIDPFYSLLGFAVGAIVGLTGVGGGSLMTPLLILLFGINPATAVGTDLLYAAATKSAGTFMHGFKKSVDWKIVFRLASGSVPGALLTIAILSFTGTTSEGDSHIVTLVLGTILLLTSITLFSHKWLMGFARAHVATEGPPRHQALLTALMGACIGVLVSVTSVGAGAIGVTALMLIYPRMPVLRIVGSDIAHAVPLTLVAGMGHWAIGNVDWTMLVSLLIGSIPGILIASHFAYRIHENVLRTLLAGILFLVGLKLLAG